MLSWLNLATFLIAAFLFLSCKTIEISETDLKEFLDRKEEVFEEISVQTGKATWNLYTEEGEADLMHPRLRYSELFGNDSLNYIIEAWHEKLDSIEDPRLRRRVQLWNNVLTTAKVDLSGDVVELQTELETWLAEDDSTLETPSREELDTMMIRLIKLRNQKARRLGFDNYPEMILEISELGSDWFYSLVRRIDSATKVPYQELIARFEKEKGKEEIEYSDVLDFTWEYRVSKQPYSIRRDVLLPLTKETVKNIGIEYDWLPLRIVERDLPPMVGGQGIAVHVPGDFRFVVRPELSFADRLHELGHGMQWIFTMIESPMLKGYEWNRGNLCGAWNEGMAETIKRFSYNDEWLKKHISMSEEEIEEKNRKSETYAPAFLRFQISTFMQEIELYKYPDRRPRDTLRKVRKKYLLMDQPIKWYAPLASMFYASYPVYTQSYFLADMISWQIHSTLEEKFGNDYVFNDEVGKFLKDNLYANGELYPWKTRLKMATGRELDVDGYLRSMGL
jgi:peptidyl-dipeptidase A